MTSDMLGDCAERALSDVGCTFHVFQGSRSEHPLAVWLHFEGLDALRFWGSSDGCMLNVDRAPPPQVIDMAELDRVEYASVAGEVAVSLVIGRRLSEVWSLSDASTGHRIGMTFDFSSSKLRILVWGDELLLQRDMPSDAAVGEIVETKLFRSS